MIKGPQTIELKIPSEHGYEKMAMNLAADTARDIGFAPERIEDLKIAVSEACINAMEHGNQFDVTTKVLITLTIDTNKLAIDVADEGRGGAPPKDVSEPDLEAQIEGLEAPGRMGLFVIKSLVDHAEFVEPDLGKGNQLRMIIHLQRGNE